MPQDAELSKLKAQLQDEEEKAAVLQRVRFTARAMLNGYRSLGLVHRCNVLGSLSC